MGHHAYVAAEELAREQPDKHGALLRSLRGWDFHTDARMATHPGVELAVEQSGSGSGGMHLGGADSRHDAHDKAVDAAFESIRRGMKEAEVIVRRAFKTTEAPRLRLAGGLDF